MLKMRKLSLSIQFWIWIFIGFIVLIVLPLIVYTSICQPQQPVVWSIYGNEYPASNKHNPTKIEYFVTPKQQKSGASSNDWTSSWLCEEAKTIDLALVFFTYCLVIVGWFAMRSTDETTKRTQRAQIWMNHATALWCKVEGGWEINVAYIMKNSGSTIGFVNYVGLAGGVCESLPQNRVDLKIKYGEFVNQVLIPPNEERPWVNMKLPGIFSEEQYQWASAGALSLFIFGEIHYADIFGENHQSGFAYRVHNGGENKAITTLVPGKGYWNYT